MSPAPYAVSARASQGRLHPEAEATTRSPWQRDRDRVIHSSGFRRLQYKTQVFINHEGDFFRTRLTHSLEVAQIARSLARRLQLDEDLTEAIALAHDLGHTPFGHAGEDALAAAMQPWGGFDHNTQALRQVTLLERRYIGFDGLNLTWETLEGLAKHNGPVDHPDEWLRQYNAIHPLELDSFASAEAQIAAMSDDIAYHGHDLDDGIRAGLISLDDLEQVPLVSDALKEARQQALLLPKQSADGRNSASILEKRIRHETIRRVINTLASDMLAQTISSIARLEPESADDIRHAPRPVVSFSPAIADANGAIREFLFARLYRHWKVNRMTSKARTTTSALFNILASDPSLLPDIWRDTASGAASDAIRMRVIADYIASMTDRFAMEEYRRLTDLSVPG
ncbi:MAG: deoxyguanosinetriphosphate triphosphohydrolase [Acetobacter sp.]|nr:deoxyguanosinetriphosphate triphosphohydrolase [Acetobacter sp.]MCH4060353.1 deoxyguanosinetriphosphate triphosphohydrolase [Acetobacter sp.]MCH4087293.1 deoxyguanosinetriphosphate triphosphohydrolase [Acetobacter sp.]MCI1293114.1 deoxyguanosinetriphosphate triphosphohydrolase [Acetobacter sp.]MCI1319700.1 deoxyguanosinetriphosphate triphosphohydrolase [Acetobacter sp.]